MCFLTPTTTLKDILYVIRLRFERLQEALSYLFRPFPRANGDLYAKFNAERITAAWCDMTGGDWTLRLLTNIRWGDARYSVVSQTAQRDVESLLFTLYGAKRKTQDRSGFIMWISLQTGTALSFQGTGTHSLRKSQGQTTHSYLNTANNTQNNDDAKIWAGVWFISQICERIKGDSVMCRRVDKKLHNHSKVLGWFFFPTK